MGGLIHITRKKQALAAPRKTGRIAEALRAEIRKILDAEPFGVIAIQQIARIAKSGIALLTAIERIPGSGKKLRDFDLPKLLNSGDDEDEGPYEVTSSGGIYNPMVSSSVGENFGAKSLREIIAMLPNLATLTRPVPAEYRPTLAELTMALREARESGNKEHAAQLQKASADLVRRTIPSGVIDAEFGPPKKVTPGAYAKYVAKQRADRTVMNTDSAIMDIWNLLTAAERKRAIKTLNAGVKS